MVNAFGEEKGDDGVNGIRGGGTEIRVQGEGSAGINAHDF